LEFDEMDNNIKEKYPEKAWKTYNEKIKTIHTRENIYREQFIEEFIIVPPPVTIKSIQKEVEEIIH
jgi:hypothetical protein